MGTTKSPVSQRECADSPEPLLLDNSISTKFHVLVVQNGWASFIFVLTKIALICLMCAVRPHMVEQGLSV